MTAPLAFGGASVDGSLYTWVTDLAHSTPHAVNAVVSGWSDYGLALFAVLMIAAWWRARGEGGVRMARVLASPVIVVVAYVANSLLKSVVDEQRPCRTLHTVTVEACPALGDWSFPSNHAVIAAAAAVTLLLADRRIGLIAVPAAVLMGASRVWIGVHYPHDVAVGLAVGATLALLLSPLATRAAPLVDRLRTTRLRPLVSTQ
ncbi:phosphatase PAP2 family protein [Streptomyces sp. NPDC056121]|uniref:phosphatase PAP2 family protein n=1 Tax=Streptomyces TaxID=1883 RepID=UPI001D0B4DDA|nr:MULTISPECIES: phosphatase PAP2 family protein [Streptomyces]MCX5083069.1 phosphatase PAP2 family protein [Streptomyces sp. NBC_00401]UDM01180.1 phosphatase PAP2 family protein [Streptomyces longhuiensis]